MEEDYFMLGDIKVIIKPRGPLSIEECKTGLLDFVYPAENQQCDNPPTYVECDLETLAREFQLVQAFAAYHSHKAPELWEKQMNISDLNEMKGLSMEEQV